MAARDAHLRAARSIKYGRLDHASARLDRERAESVIAGLSSDQGRRLVWAGGLTEAVERAAGAESDSRRPSVARHVSNTRTLIGADAEYDRIREVAWLDERLLVAARHTAASRVPADDRLAFRTSIPSATLVSRLAVAAVLHPSGRVDKEMAALASRLVAAGVLAAWFLADGEVILVPRPDLSVAEGRLHSLDRAAARWAEESLWFWQGVWIPEHLAARRDELGLADVLGERNVERRRVLIDVIGFETLVQAASGGVPAQQDDYGRLWRLGPLLDDEEYVAVEVLNSTPEPDGSFRRYFLRVPPTTKTARAGVAWTFELSPRDYVLAAQS